MNLIAQFFGVLAIIANIVGMQFKQKKHIMIAFLLATFCFSINFVLLKAYSGALICFIQSIEIFINYLYDIKDKKYPPLLIGTYVIISIVCGVLTYNNLFDILPVLSSLIFIIAITQTKERYIRFLTLIFISLFAIYDILVGAYLALLSDILHDTSTIIAIMRYDVLKKSDKNIIKGDKKIDEKKENTN